MRFFLLIKTRSKMPKYPNIEVNLTNEDGNAFVILARCRVAAKKAGLTKEEIETFTNEAEKDDYDHLLQVCQRWFNCI